MKYRLQDLIDIEHFQNLQDRLNEIYSFSSAIIDNEGNILTATAWQDICAQFHRKNKECEQFCIKSDQYILSHLEEANPAVSYRCPHGLVDNATPIIIDGIHYGNFFTGQFFLETPDMDYFRAQAQRYGFDEDAYLAAVKKVPIWTQEQMNGYLYFIKGLITIISESGLKKLKEMDTRRQIEETEERANTILSQMHEGFWIINPQNAMIVDANEAMCRMLGYTHEEIVNMSAPEIATDYSLEESIQGILHTVEAGSDHFETRLRQKNGTMIDIEADITFLPKRDLLFGFQRQITERMQTEAALRESEANLREAQEIARLGRWELDIATGSFQWSEGIHTLFDVDAETFASSYEAYLEFIHPEDRAMVDHAYYESVENKQPFEIEHRLQIKDGRIKWVSTIGRTEYDEAGNPVRSVGTVQNITEHKRTEEELYREQLLTKTLLDSLPGIFYLYSYPELRLVRWNKNHETLLGYGPGEIKNRSIMDWHPPEAKEAVMKAIEKGMEMGQNTIESPLLTKDGRSIPFIMTGVKLELSGQTYLMGVGIDITERIQMEELLRIQHELAIDLNSCSDLHQGLKKVLNAVLQFECIDCGGIYMADPVNNSLDLVTYHGLSQEFVANTSHYSTDSPQVRMAMTGTTHYGMYADISPTKDKICKKEGLRAFAIIPVMTRGRLIAVLNLASHSNDSIPTKTRNSLETIVFQSSGTLLRLRTDVALRESEERYRRITDTMTDYIFTSYIEGGKVVKTVHGPGCIAVTGYSVEDFTTDPYLWLNMILPEDRDCVKKHALRILTEKDLSPIEHRIQRKDGSVRWVQNTPVPHRDSSGAIISYDGLITDITERKQAETALREVNDLLSLFIANSPIHAYIKEVTPTESRVLHASENFHDMIGIPGSQMVGKTMEGLFPKEFAEKITADDWAVASRGKILTVDEELNGREYTTIKFPIYLGGRILLAGYTIDITERIRSEEALRESEALLSITLEAGNAGGWEWNLENDTVHFDARFHAMLGYEPGELPTTLAEWSAFHHPDDRSGTFSKAEAYIRGETPVYEHEHRIRSKTGAWVWIFTRGKTVKISPTGSARMFIGIAINITERKQSEEALKESESKLSGIIEFLPDATFVIDLEGKVIAWNQAMEQMTGVLHEEMIGKGNHEYSIPFYGQRRPLLIDLALIPDDEFERNHYEGVYRTGDTLNAEAYVPGTYQGKGASLLGTSSRLRDAYGHIAGAIESIRDISNLKHAEKELRESEEKFRLLVENSNDIIYTLTLDGVFTFVSPAWTTLLGHPANQVVGKSFRLFVHPDDVEGCRAFLEKTVSTGQRQEGVEYRVQHTDGSWRWHTSNGVPLRNETGAIVGFEGIARDITEHKHAEEEKDHLQTQLLQAQKMEAVGRLAGGVAHDFNNMLSVILGNTEMALMSLDPSEPLYADLQEIQKAGRRSNDLTRQLLAFARKQTVAPKVLDLNETVEGMLTMLRRLIGEDISLSWNPCNDLVQVKIDPSQLDQILANLCVNARDAIIDVGKITIETANVVFDEEYCIEHAEFTPGAYVMLAISDNGCGMDKETLSKLFEPFFTTKEMGKGTGLGLSTVYGIVKQNNGFINIYSEPGEGTTFKIYLPNFGDKAGHFKTERPPEAAKTGSETILLVEDEPAILKLGKTILERIGYTVLVAHKPGDAIRLADEYNGQIHLLMTDVVMPDMNGRDLAKHMLSLYPNIKILFMSGYTSNVIAHHGVLDEGVHFIQKPFSLKDLSYKVREALDGK